MNAEYQEEKDLAKWLDKNRLTKVGDFTVETWWDRFTRNWVTQLKDAEGNQIGEAPYNGDKVSAAYSHRWKIADAHKLAKPVDKRDWDFDPDMVL